jgi:hypothetical protein
MIDMLSRATVVVLYRPSILGGQSNLGSEIQGSWQQTTIEQARTAAFTTNAILEKIIELDKVHLLKPMM